MPGLLVLAGCAGPAGGPLPAPTPPTDGAATLPAPSTVAQTTESPGSSTTDSTSTDSGGSTDTTGTTGLGATPDYSLPGPYAVSRGSGTFAASCSMAYDTFTPDGHAPAAWVVLAHGLLRDRGPMEGLAEHLASWGLAVVAPDVCHETLPDLDYGQNALNLVALGASVGGGAPVLQAGHSAGAVSSFVAASIDPLAVGHLGLDLADVAWTAQAAAPTLPVPSWGILGEPGFCNLYGNAVDVYAEVPDHELVRVVGAGHCDFEDPTDLECTVPCGAGSGAAVHPAIQGMAAAAALALTGEDPRGAEFWTPGDAGYDALLAAGVIAEP